MRFAAPAIFLTCAVSVFVLAAPRDSYLVVADGKSVANGAPIDVKAVKAKLTAPFFWFTLDGKPYVTRDPAALGEVKHILQPLFTLDDESTAQTSGGGSTTNDMAAKANRYAARLPQINRTIEQQLHNVAVRLVREGKATPAEWI